jgi:DNA-binding SARP family transcriptional activator/WD40 repeat protein/serine/threonine protein kinase
MMDLELRVLGPLAALRADGPMSLGGPKQRTVLAMLVQAVGRRVRVDELILAVYGEDPPAGARRTVQTYVSNLRHHLGDVIQGGGDGYVLGVPPSAIDADRFEAAYRAGLHELEREPDRTAARLAEALAMWRGHAYADVDAHGALDAEIARLHELRLDALEHRIGADLALGRHHELLAELESLAAEHPFRESLRAHQVVALYRSGRQSDALAVVGRTRRVLTEELGIDLSPQLQQLERRILIQDASLELVTGPRIERRVVLVAELDAENWSAARRAEALTLRDQVLADVVDGAGATIVGLRGTAAFVVFDDMEVAVQKAAALAGLAPTASLRIALDHGDVELREDAVTGPPINRVARIVALAHPGQVLLSPEAHRVMSGGDLVGWGAMALGRHVVAGVDEALAIYQLQGEGLRDRFPPLRTGHVPPPVPRSTPASVPGYELRERLAAGDASVLYRAYQASVGREVVLRAIRRELAVDPAFIRRFEAEGQRVARLAHPHTLGLLDYWRDPDGAYLVHPFIAGVDLRQRLARGDITPARSLELLEQIGATLSHGHARGVVHGRLHPGNVLIDEADNLYVSDLGLAQMCDGLITSTAHAYSAPETLGGGSVTVAGDVYALGVMAFEVLEGRRPPHDEGLPVPTSRVGEVIARATETDPTERFEDVDVLLDALRAAMAGTTAPHRPRTAVRNPYRGLEPFQEADAQDFHGRESLVAEMVQVLSGHRLLTVVGPSGIGKSSVVRAGLVPALRRGAIDGSEHWLVTDLFPGSRPFEELASALRRVAVDTTDDLRTELRSSETGLVSCVQRLLPPNSELLLLVDQFEELFTQTPDDEARRAFLALLAATVADPASRVHIVVTLRADFFGRPLRYASFAEVMRPGLVTVPAPTRDELARAVREPAEGVGVAVEDRLVDRILDDTDGEPGALPLLQYLLAELFATRDANQLTLDDYVTSGGVRGAIGRKAEEVYLGLDSDHRDAVREVLLRLVTVDESDEDTRRRVRVGEVSRLGADGTHPQGVLAAFGRVRLLTFDHDPVTRGPTVEVAHEALIAEWDRLRGWIDEVRDDLLTRRRITASVREWKDGSRDPSFLLRGARLEAAERFERSSGLSLTDEERAYVAASRQATDAEHARSRRRRRRTLAALSGALVVTVVLGGVALAQRGLAREQAELTRARHLASEALRAIDADPERGILLALEALEAHRDPQQRPLAEAVSALQTALQASRVEWHLPESGYLSVAFSPDGRLIATDSLGEASAELLDQGSTVHVVDADSGNEVASVEGAGRIGHLAFSPDGSMLAVAYLDTDGAPAIEAFATDTWQRLASYEGPGSGYWSVRFTDDGRYLVVAGDPLTAWEVATGEVTAAIDETGSMDVVPGTTTIAIVTERQEVRFVDIRDGETVETLATPGITGDHLAIHPDGGRVAVRSFADRVVEIWDRGSGDRLAAFGNPSPLEIRWSPDGKWLAHSANDGTIRLVDADGGGDEVVLRGHTDGVTGLAFAPDGDRLASTSWASETRLWDLTDHGPVELGNPRVLDGRPRELATSADGSQVAATIHLPGEMVRIDLLGRTEDSRTIVDGLSGPGHHEVRIAQDLTAAAGLDDDHRGHVFSLPSGESRLALPACLSPRAISSDGSRLVVDGRLLCTEVEGSHQVFSEPPADAALRSAVLDARTGETIYDLQDRVVSWASLGPVGTPAERYVALIVSFRRIELHDLDTGRLVGAFERPPDVFLSVWFSEDGRHLAFGTQSGRVTAFDVAAAAPDASLEDTIVWSFEEPAGGAVTKTLIDRGRLATIGMTGHVRLYDLADRRVLVDIEVEVDGPPSLAFSPDGSALIYTDGTALRWLELDPETLAGLARSRLTRGLTDEECTQYDIGHDACAPTDAAP